MGSIPMLKDWTGCKRYRFTFVKRTIRKTSSGQYLWKVLCECGKTVIIRPSMTMGKNPTKSCGCIRKEISINGSSTRKHTPLIATARNVWLATYRDCDFETFYSLSQQPCHYCGCAPSSATTIKNRGKFQTNHGKFIYNGLDRVDNGKGHIKNNIVTCCKRCNIAKNNMTLSEFLNMIERIYDRMIRYPLGQTAPSASSAQRSQT